MPYPPRLLHLQEIGDDAILWVQILLDVGLADVVYQIEVEMVHLALPELLLEDLLGLGHVGEVVSGELVGEEEAVAGISLQEFPHGRLRSPVMISPRGIVIVDAGGHAAVNQFGRLLHIDVGVVLALERQAHRAESHLGYPESLEVLVDHVIGLATSSEGGLLTLCQR